jgi:hypothetical protein
MAAQQEWQVLAQRLVESIVAARYCWSTAKSIGVIRELLNSDSNNKVINGRAKSLLPAERARNRSILISDAVWPVLGSIAGDPKVQIDDLSENLRKNASK